MSECKFGCFRDEDRGVCLTAAKGPLVVPSDTGFETINCLCQNDKMQHWGDVEAAHDAVNSPSHYASGEIECIDAIKASMTAEAFRGYLKGNVQKYMWRYEKKVNAAEDLKKARWYLDKLIEEVEL